MERWQEAVIKKNLNDLKRFTTCNTSFLAYLQQVEILSDDDISILDNEERYKGKSAQTILLYKTVIKRKSGFEALVEALEETKQTGALDILNKAKAQRENDGINSKRETPSWELGQWREEHIRQNLPKLLQTTSINDSLLLEVSHFLNSEDDRALAEATRKESGGGILAIKLLYTIAAERDGMYEGLTRALFKANQYTAFQVLLRGLLEQRPDGVFTICKISEENDLFPSALKGLEKYALQYPVTFQNHQMLLQEILPLVDKTLLDSIAEQHLNGKLLVQMLNNKRPVLTNNTIPTPLKYYIPRRLTGRQQLHPKLFDKAYNDVFIIKGIQPYQLSEIAQNQGMDGSSNQILELNVRFIILEYEEDFEKICQISCRRSVHLLNYQEGRFIWLKTHGSLSSLQGHIHIVDNQQHLNEDEFVKLCLERDQPICLSDTPGMGKSVLLARIAEQLVICQPAKLVKFVVLREFIPEVENRREGSIDRKFLINLIADLTSDSEFGKQVVKKLLASEAQSVELLFDGFDEVLPAQVKTAKQVLKNISSWKSVRLYITTRPHMRDELENTVGVLGYNIMAFGEDEQIDFLTKYWKSYGAMCDTRIREYSKNCLQTLKKTMNDFEGDIAGIPLQCSLLAEVYQEEAIKYSKDSESENRVLLTSEPRVTSLFDIYKNLMKLRFQKINNTNGEKSRGFLKTLLDKFVPYDENWRVKAVTRLHMYNALKLLFPDHAKHFKSDLSLNFNKLESQLLYAVGILEKKGTDDDDDDDQTPRFGHRTYAEYFFALLVVQTWVQDPDISPGTSFRNTFNDFVFKMVLLTSSSNDKVLSSLGDCELKSHSFQYPVVCYFINQHLKHTKIPKTAENLPGIFGKANLYEMLASCVPPDHSTLYAQMSESEAYKMFQSAHVSLPHLPYLSVKYSSLHFCKMIHDQYLKQYFGREYFFSSTSPNFMVTPLHVAVERGHFSITSFLMNLMNTLELLELHYLIHCCVVGTTGNSSSVILQKVQIIKLLSNKNTDWINEPLPDGTAPLLQSNVHLKLVECLIECGADVNVSNETGCVLHKQVENGMDSESYHDFVEFLLKHGFTSFNMHDANQRVPLHLALQNMELKEETLQLFHSNGADFNASDKGGESILFHAISRGRSLNLVKVLLSMGADLKHVNWKNENVLHACLKYGNHVVFQYLLESNQLGANELKVTNKNGQSPFTVGISIGKRPSFHIVQLIEKNGIEITKEMASEALMGLICNKNIMPQELDNEFVQVANYLVSKGAVVECRNGMSPWELEALQKNMKSIVEATECNAKLLETLAKMEIDGMGNQHESEELYRELKVYENSYEKICISLISCNQIKPFLLLKQCLQLAMQESKFITCTKGLMEFIHSTHDKVALVRSWDAELTISRIQNTIYPDILVIQEEDLGKTEIPSRSLIIFQCGKATTNFIQQLSKFNTKTVCVCTQVDEDLECSQPVLLQDNINWEDLSNMFQSKLRSQMRVKVDGVEHKLKNLFDPSLLKNEILAAFIRYQVADFTTSKSFSQEETFSGCLLNTIFEYFLPFKIAFQGITEHELKGYAQYGHKIGKVGDKVETLDYIIVQNLTEFNEICKAPDHPKYLFEYNQSESQFKLVHKVSDTDLEMERFLEKNPQQQQCEDYPLCTCGNHPFGSCNLQWSAFRFQNRTYWVYLHDLISAMQTISPRSEGRVEFQNNVTINNNLEFWSYAVTSIPDLRFHASELLPIMELNKFQVFPDLQRVAVITLFPHLIKTVENNTWLENLVHLGILTWNRSSFVFVDKPLAWYFIAELVTTEEPVQFVDLSKLLDEVFRDCIKTKVQISHTFWNNSNYSSSYISSFKFLNSAFFKILSTLLNTRPRANEIISAFLKNFGELNASMCAHACVQANHFNLLRLLCGTGVYNSFVFTSEQLVILAVKYSDLQILDLITSFQMGSSKFTDIELDMKLSSSSRHSTKISVLHVAALRGSFLLFEYLLLRHGFTNMLRQDIMRNLIVFCLYDTQTRDEQVEDRKRIISILLEFHPDYINKINDNSDGHLQLFVPNAHVDLVLHLINLGADVHAVDKNLNNILHLSPQYVSPQEYDKLVRTLQDREESKIFHAKNKWERNPLHIAIMYLAVLDSTLEILISSKNVEPNVVDVKLLFFAVIYRKSARLLKFLFDTGVHTHMPDYFNHNVLHVAAEHCNLTALRYFLYRGVEVNATDDNDYTPLHLTMKYSKTHVHEMVLNLTALTNFVSHGIDTTTADEDNLTPLHFSMKYSKIKYIHSLVRALLQHGADVNVISRCGNTPLSYALERMARGEIEERTVDLLKETIAQSNI